MDVTSELKRLQCGPGPTHSPNECPCDMEYPCACVVYGSAIDEINRLRTENAALRACFSAATVGWSFDQLKAAITAAKKYVSTTHT